MSLYLLKTWWRSPSRALALALGVLLAVSMFCDMNLNLTATGAHMLDGVLSNLYADSLVYYKRSSSENWTIEEINRALTSIEEVVDVEAIAYLPFFLQPTSYLTADGSKKPSVKLTENFSKLVTLSMYAISEEFPSKVGMSLLEGSWNFTGILVSKDLAEDASLKAGDTVRLVIEMEQPNYTIHWTSCPLPITGVIEPSENATAYLTAQIYRTKYLVRPPRKFYAMFFPYELLENVTRSFPFAIQVSFGHYVWARRSELVDPWNLDATKERLDLFEARLRTAVQPYGAEVFCFLRMAVTALSGMIDFTRFLLGALSFPVLLLCWYLVVTTGHLISQARRREIGLLKVRGFSSNSILASYIVIALLIGLGGSLLGVLLGSLMFYGYCSMANLPLPSNLLGLVFSTPTLAMEVCLGCFLSVVASIIPARTAARLSPLEATREYLEAETSAIKVSKWVLLALILGTLKMVEWAADFDPVEFLSSLRGAPFFVIVPYFMYAMFDALVLNFLGPVLFIYGISCVLIANKSFLLRVADLFVRPLKSLKSVISGNLTRNPARLSRVTFLVAVCLAFSLMTALLIASFNDLHYRSSKVVVGSDLRVFVFEGTELAFGENLSRVEGVSVSTPVVYGLGAEAKLCGRVDYYAVDPETFAQVAYLERNFCDPPFEECLERMSANSSYILISEALADEYYLRVGDTLWIRSQTCIPLREFIPVKICGIVRTMPGSAVSPFAKTPFIVLSLDLAEQMGLDLSAPYFLVKLTDGSDPREVAQRIREEFPDQVASISTVEDVLAESPTTPLLSSICAFLDHCSICTVLAASCGLLLISIVNVRERMYELGLMRSRGFSRRNAVKALVYEAVIVVFLASVVGVLSGVVSANGLIHMMGRNSAVSPNLIIPLFFWLVLFGTFGLLVAFYSLPLVLFFRKTVVETIRFR